jgi:hypothetical protein
MLFAFHAFLSSASQAAVITTLPLRRSMRTAWSLTSAETLSAQIAGITTLAEPDAFTLAEPDAFTLAESYAVTLADSDALTLAEPYAFTLAEPYAFTLGRASGKQVQRAHRCIILPR